MTKIFIYTALLFIVVTAIFETKDLLSYLEQRSAYSKTPAQMEMSVPLNRKEVQSHSLNFQENTQNLHDKFRKENEKKEQNKGVYELNKSNKAVGR